MADVDIGVFVDPLKSIARIETEDSGDAVKDTLTRQVSATHSADGIVQTKEEAAKKAANGRLFILIVLLEIAVNYDSGAVPAVLGYMRTDFALKPSDLGWLGGLQYLGLFLMCPIAGKLLTTQNAKPIILFSILFNIAFCALFAMAPSKGLLLFCRLGIGMTQTPLVVFAPVWVDEFAGDSAALWLSILQGSIPLGVRIPIQFQQQTKNFSL